jgi:hypothetical protein
MAKFSRSHYQMLAGALHKAQDVFIAYETDSNRLDRYQHGKKVGALIAAEMIADVLGMDNPAFDREHFLAVICGDAPVNSRPPSRSSIDGEVECTCNHSSYPGRKRHDVNCPMVRRG